MKLNEDNFLLYAMRNYDNSQCAHIKEFEEDLKRFLYLRKLFNRYINDGELRERLILNHIIVLYNLFGDAATNMLFYKTESMHWSALVTFLIYLNRMPDKMSEYGIEKSLVTLDNRIVESLRKI